MSAQREVIAEVNGGTINIPTDVVASWIAEGITHVRISVTDTHGASDDAARKALVDMQKIEPQIADRLLAAGGSLTAAFASRVEKLWS